MNKTLLALMATSAFALSGCFSLIGMGVGHMAEGKKATKQENEYAKKLHTTFAENKQKWDELPTELDDLEKAWTAWNNLYDQIESYRRMEHFGNKKLGSCVGNKDRANEKNCKEALVLRGKVAARVAQTLHAAVDATPELGNDFPLWQIVRTQRHADLAKAVDVEATLGKLVPKLDEFWAKRAKKVGGAETLVRKANAGSCFFTDEPQGDLLKPRFAFSAKADELFIKCVAPQSIDSYERTQKDLVLVNMLTDRMSDRVETLPGNHTATGQSFDVAIPISKFRKAAKSSEGEDIKLGAGEGGPAWRFVIVEVSYSTFKKVGTTAYHNGSGTSFKDDIRDTSLASGMMVLDLEGTLGAMTTENDETDDDDNDDEAPKAKKSKSKKHQTAQRLRKKKSRSR